MSIACRRRYATASLIVLHSAVSVPKRGVVVDYCWCVLPAVGVMYWGEDWVGGDGDSVSVGGRVREGCCCFEVWKVFRDREF